jgi:hypothetical protein
MNSLFLGVSTSSITVQGTEKNYEWVHYDLGDYWNEELVSTEVKTKTISFSGHNIMNIRMVGASYRKVGLNWQYLGLVGAAVSQNDTDISLSIIEPDIANPTYGKSGYRLYWEPTLRWQFGVDNLPGTHYDYLPESGEQYLPGVTSPYSTISFNYNDELPTVDEEHFAATSYSENYNNLGLNSWQFNIVGIFRFLTKATETDTISYVKDTDVFSKNVSEYIMKIDGDKYYLNHTTDVLFLTDDPNLAAPLTLSQFQVVLAYGLIHFPTHTFDTNPIPYYYIYGISSETSENLTLNTYTSNLNEFQYRIKLFLKAE